MTAIVGVVVALTRFPVKSTAGQSLSAVGVSGRGLLHDRSWAAYTEDGGIASGKTTRRFRSVPGLLAWSSAVAHGQDVPVLHGPAGDSYPADDPAASRALSAAFGRPLALRVESAVPHHDASPVHLVTTASVRRLEQLLGRRVDVRRLRANLVLDVPGDGFVEDAWTGGELAVGADVVLRPGDGMPRCVMVEQTQAGVAAGPRVLPALARTHGTLLGLQAQMLTGGIVRVGDTVSLRT